MKLAASLIVLAAACGCGGTSNHVVPCDGAYPTCTSVSSFNFDTCKCELVAPDASAALADMSSSD